MTVTRYGMDYVLPQLSEDMDIVEKTDGDYVSYEDFKRVLSALAESKRQITTLKLKLLDSIGSHKASAYYDFGRVADSVIAEFSESE